MTRAGWMAVAVLSAGCATAPLFNPPALEIVTPTAWATEVDGGDAPDFDWWTDFGDTGLDEVVVTALAQNYDLQAASARLEQAAADSRIAAAGLQPTIQVGLNGSRRKQNFIGFPIPGSEDQVLSTVFTNYGVSLDTTWEADLWDRLRSGARAALADLQSRAADLRAAQLSIAGQAVKTWFAIAEAQQHYGSRRRRSTASATLPVRSASDSKRGCARHSMCDSRSRTSPAPRRYVTCAVSSSTRPYASSRCSWGDTPLARCRPRRRCQTRHPRFLEDCRPSSSAVGPTSSRPSVASRRRASGSTWRAPSSIPGSL